MIQTTKIRKKCFLSSKTHVALSSPATYPSSGNERYLHVLEMAVYGRICRIPNKRRIGNKSDEDDTSSSILSSIEEHNSVSAPPAQESNQSSCPSPSPPDGNTCTPQNQKVKKEDWSKSFKNQQNGYRVHYNPKYLFLHDRHTRKKLLPPTPPQIMSHPTLRAPTRIRAPYPKYIRYSCDIILSWKDLGYCFVVERGKRLDLEIVFRLRRSLVEFVVLGHGMRMQSFAVPCSSALLPRDVISIVRLVKYRRAIPLLSLISL